MSGLSHCTCGSRGLLANPGHVHQTVHTLDFARHVVSVLTRVPLWVYESSQHGTGDPLYLGPTSTDLATSALKYPETKNPKVPRKLNLSLPCAKLCVQPHASRDVWACPVISWTLSVSRAPYVSLATAV